MLFISTLSTPKYEGLILLQLLYIHVTQQSYCKHHLWFIDKSCDSTWVIHIAGTSTTSVISLALEDYFHKFYFIKSLVEHIQLVSCFVVSLSSDIKLPNGWFHPSYMCIFPPKIWTSASQGTFLSSGNQIYVWTTNIVSAHSTNL